MTESGQKGQAQSWVLWLLFCHITQLLPENEMFKETGTLAQAIQPDPNFLHKLQNQAELKRKSGLANSV